MKNAKILTLLIGVLMASCTPSKNEENPQMSKQLQAVTFGDITLDSIETELDYETVYADTYEESKLSARKAKARLELYKILKKISAPANRPYDPKKDLYGFTFKLDYLQQFLKEIEAINQNYPDSIDGVRVYYSRDLPSQKVKHEVFLIPTKKFKNIYPIDDDFTQKSTEYDRIWEDLKSTENGDLILDTSVPCPQECGGAS